jgi:PAB-dependent poly(A)-specific ribonuclease subunit 2
VYKKLRLLVDRGCIFIGHGLSKDFRIISKPQSLLGSLVDNRPPVDIYVPLEQVIDTVDLYFLRERQRRLSLRFLSWFVLGENIQTDTHDSVEDARSALMLYNAYQEFEEQGIFDEKLDELYREGPKHVGGRFHKPWPAPFTPRRTGNHQPHRGQRPHRLRYLPLPRLQHNQMRFPYCVVA